MLCERGDRTFSRVNKRIQSSLLPIIVQQVRTLADFQKTPEKEAAICAEISKEEEVKAGDDTSELRFYHSIGSQAGFWSDPLGRNH